MNRVIYIIGAGRSGTTLLDIILGNAPDVFSTGELNRYTKRDGIPHDARDAEVECFWEEIKTRLDLQYSNTPAHYYPLSRKYEYHTGVPNITTYRNSHSFTQYAAYQQSILELLSEQAASCFGKKIVVDSSKYPLRAFFLSKILGEKISFIYIHRNPHSVVESFQKKDVEQPSKNKLAANAYLLGVNALSRKIYQKLKSTHKATEIAYESLLADPVESLTRIEKDLDLDLAEPKRLLENDLPLQVGLLFDGNRLRLDRHIVFRKGGKVQQATGFLDKAFYSLHKLIWYKQ